MPRQDLKIALERQLYQCNNNHCYNNHEDFCELCDSIICDYIHEKLHITKEQSCEGLTGALLFAHDHQFNELYNKVYLPLVKKTRKYPNLKR